MLLCKTSNIYKYVYHLVYILMYNLIYKNEVYKMVRRKIIKLKNGTYRLSFPKVYADELHVKDSFYVDITRTKNGFAVIPVGDAK